MSGCDRWVAVHLLACRELFRHVLLNGLCRVFKLPLAPFSAPACGGQLAWGVAVGQGRMTGVVRRWGRLAAVVAALALLAGGGPPPGARHGGGRPAAGGAPGARRGRRASVLAGAPRGAR